MKLPPEDLSENLAAKLSFRFLLKGVDVILTLVTGVIVARLLGPEILGTFASALAISMLFSLLANDGLGTAHLKIINSGYDKGECLASFIAVKLVFILLGALCLIIHLRITPFGGDREYFIVLAVCGGVAVFSQVSQILITNFDAYVHSVRAESSTFLGSSLRNCVKVVISFLGLGAIALGCAELAGAVFVLFAGIFLSRGYSISKPKRHLMLKYLVLSLPLFVNSFSRGAVLNLDKAMIKYFLPVTIADVEVGIYTAGQRLGNLIQMFSIVTAITFFPVFSSLCGENKIDRMKEIIINFENMFIFVFLPAVIALAVFSLPVILFLVGEDYRASSAIMQIAILGSFAIVLFQPYINFIVGGRNLIRIGCYIHIVFLLSNLILNFILIPKSVFGVTMLGWYSLGAAVGSTVSYFILGVAAKMIASRYMKINTFGKYKWEFIILFLMSGIFLSILHFTELEGILYACFGIPMFIITFWVMMYMIRRDHFREALVNISKIHPRLNCVGR